MKTAYFDCSYGVAGDMILGSLVDAGAPFDEIKKQLEHGLHVHGITLEMAAIERSGVRGTSVKVRISHEHDHHRHLGDIVQIINGSDLPDMVKERAVRAYELLAKAEAQVHGTTPEKIHFHEVGCLDAIADVAGSMLAMHLLGVERVTASPIVVGSGGTARCAHGTLPVPAPATVEILKGIPTLGGAFAMEMATPTGAAILAAVSDEFGPQPMMAVGATGNGAGTREIPQHANFLRVMIGESVGKESGNAGAGLKNMHASRLYLIMTEIDDMSPELLGDFLSRLFAAGCLDAHFTPIQMKKNRPAVQLQVLVSPDKKDALAEMILRETTTFGLKVIEMERLCLPRKADVIDTELGALRVKIGYWGDEILKVTPEYESCRELAEKSGRTLAAVYHLAERMIEKTYFGQ